MTLSAFYLLIQVLPTKVQFLTGTAIYGLHCVNCWKTLEAFCKYLDGPTFIADRGMFCTKKRFLKRNFSFSSKKMIYTVYTTTYNYSKAVMTEAAIARD
jgi:hypothetical protein